MRPREAAGGQAIEGKENAARGLHSEPLPGLALSPPSLAAQAAHFGGHPLAFYLKVSAPICAPSFGLIYSVQPMMGKTQGWRVGYFH